ncbi:MAG TPA: DNA-processing protein DprA [Bacteroidia bacterium]|jgi:DNA processing protein|nr:DNA-processing protein DprA [Bacteroidia bacterium]
MSEDLKYKIALTLLPNIGDVLAKKLLSYCGSVEQIFKEKKATLEKIPGIGRVYAQSISTHAVFERAEEEMRFISDHNIQTLFYQDSTYPKRLTYCEDGPVMLYFKGDTDLNAKKVISIVGTREATDYGKDLCEKLIRDLAGYEVLIVSGLAHGIDAYAHRAALDQNLPTVCVLAHGLDNMYPAINRPLAMKMLEQGGWLSDFMSRTKADKENFPRRNRIVAGISDATIVVESKAKGGSLITAEIANSYSRDVFAFPGRVDDLSSAGCNNLIRQHKAALVQSAADVIYMLGWEKTIGINSPIQKQLFIELKPNEELIVSILKEKQQLPIDDLCLLCKLPMSIISSVLLTLEFAGIIKSLPGKVYRLN